MGKKVSDDGKPPRPRKRPSQERSVFTVQALYDGFVRIWRRDGPDAASMRAVAAESGFAVGTLYEYFPNREALLSGYYLHCLELLCERIGRADADAAGQPWQARLRAAVGATLDEAGEGPYFDAAMLFMEHRVAQAREHRRAFARLRRTWSDVLTGWSDLPSPEEGTIDALVLMLWGAWRYALLLEQREALCAQADEISRALVGLLGAPQGR